MVRKDNWTFEDDQLLATTILTNIAKGKTQLSAFTEVGLKLKRTHAACGFRWNSTVRHRYKSEISEAKLKKIKNKISPPSLLKDKPQTIEDIIRYLQAMYDDLQITESQIKIYQAKIQDVSLEIASRRSERSLDASQNKEALALLLTKAAELGLFEQNKKPAI
ncbi:RsfA family transcriptional regulator [Paenibacillus sp. M2]|uniref:RsfA family transcriptional regulator n=1 Tax=Paenibacillus sp. M2 TaxID=3341793 RepID=UPI0039890863